ADGELSLVELSPRATSMTQYAAASLRYLPGEATALARAIVDPLTSVPGACDPSGLAEARRLAGAGKVVVVVGRPSLAEDEALVAEAVQILSHGLPDATFLPALRRGNVMGALDMGLSPGLLPGRVGLEPGRQWFTEAWGALPGARGLGTTGMLASAAGSGGEGGSASEAGSTRIRALVILGADLLTDFPDAALAERGIAGCDFVVSVASSPGPMTERADVVLPAAEAHERPGTTTNVEGRISRLGQKVVPPGQAWPDWIIATELAVHLGSDLHLDSLTEAWNEIEHVAPAYRGITGSVLDSPEGTDGVVAPLASTPVALRRRPATTPLDPIAFPGVESVERQGAPPRAGLAELPTAGTEGLVRPRASTRRASDDPPALGPAPTTPTGPAAVPETGTTVPTMLSGPADLAVPHVAPTDSYSMRLVASRRLYDRGSAVGAVEVLAGLVADAELRVNPHDLDDLGLSTGARVRVRTAATSLVLEAVPDPSLPRNVVAADFNVPLAEGTVADLIDITSPVTELRLETP
ncbi:MAG: molybdopterin oxidoreductase family protein, partial [Acidimicrobiales bacterium]